MAPDFNHPSVLKPLHESTGRIWNEPNAKGTQDAVRSGDLHVCTHAPSHRACTHPCTHASVHVCARARVHSWTVYVCARKCVRIYVSRLYVCAPRSLPTRVPDSKLLCAPHLQETSALHLAANAVTLPARSGNCVMLPPGESCIVQVHVQSIDGYEDGWMGGERPGAAARAQGPVPTTTWL